MAEKKFCGATKVSITNDTSSVTFPCPNCGKSVKEIQKALIEGKKDPEKEKKILERLKKQGLDFNVQTKF